MIEDALEANTFFSVQEDGWSPKRSRRFHYNVMLATFVDDDFNLHEMRNSVYVSPDKRTAETYKTTFEKVIHRQCKRLNLLSCSKANLRRRVLCQEYLGRVSCDSVVPPLCAGVARRSRGDVCKCARKARWRSLPEASGYIPKPTSPHD